MWTRRGESVKFCAHYIYLKVYSIHDDNNINAMDGCGGVCGGADGWGKRPGGD